MAPLGLEPGERIKLCMRCEQALRQGGKVVLRRVNTRYGQEVRCDVCGEFRHGGEYECAGKLKDRGKTVKKGAEGET